MDNHYIKRLLDENLSIFMYDYLLVFLEWAENHAIFPEEILSLDHLTFSWYNGDIKIEIIRNSNLICIHTYEKISIFRINKFPVESCMEYIKTSIGSGYG